MTSRETKAAKIAKHERAKAKAKKRAEKLARKQERSDASRD